MIGKADLIMTEVLGYSGPQALVAPVAPGELSCQHDHADEERRLCGGMVPGIANIATIQLWQPVIMSHDKCGV